MIKGSGYAKIVLSEKDIECIKNNKILVINNHDSSFHVELWHEDCNSYDLINFYQIGGNFDYRKADLL